MGFGLCMLYCTSRPIIIWDLRRFGYSMSMSSLEDYKSSEWVDINKYSRPESGSRCWYLSVSQVDVSKGSGWFRGEGRGWEKIMTGYMHWRWGDGVDGLYAFSSFIRMMVLFIESIVRLIHDGTVYIYIPWPSVCIYSTITMKFGRVHYSMYIRT